MALLQKINIDDVIIYDKELLPNGYNIGNLLNIPYLLDLWKQIPHNSITQYNNMIDKSKTWPQSIVGLYCKDRPENENIPNINRLVKSVNLYIEQNYNNFDMIDLVKDKDTLCIHIRSGDIGVISNNFITNIKKLIVNYKKIILFGGVHLDSRYGTEKQNKINFIKSINLILNLSDKIYISIDHPDVHISLMSLASNLLLHKGTYSVLLSLINKNNLFLTNEFEGIKCRNWLKLGIKYKLLT